MIVERFPTFPSLTGFPVKRLRAVGAAYRQGVGEGLDRPTCLRLSIEAYVVAGGSRASAVADVPAMVEAIAAEMPGWLWAAATDWLEQQAGGGARSSVQLRLAA
ncbi:hypothetical protein [Roseomonas populi]|uniref:Uncharacterized protein n=1 Tax=Roseomonas populi TaxID=3121582 RepID=A0ABT1WXM9_9PROT|nr:hypothetical protein [Roseomonas pecuniae]MCR0980595.1 hypothetical protein [Roseomonas pecuniae]